MLRKNNKAASEASKRFSMLPFLYGLLVFALAAGAGWLTYLDYKNPTSVGLSSSETEIAAVTLGDHPKKGKTQEAPEGEVASIDAVHPPDAHSTPDTKDIETKPETHKNSETAHPIPDEHPAPETAEVQEPEQSTKPVTTETLNETPNQKPTEPQTAEPKTPDPVKTDQLAAVQSDQPTEPVSKTPQRTPNFKVEQAPAEEKLALLPVPDPEIAKKSDFGLLPIIGPNGKMPWRTYGKPFDDPLARPRIAIVMSEMGMSASATQTAIQKLPGAVTLSFNPYARDLQSWIEQSRAAGHEVLLQIPMEPFGYPNNDPGPHSLLTSLTDRENLNRLDWLLGRFTGYSGVTNQMGSRFTSSLQDMAPILSVLNDRGLLFLDGRTSAKSVGGKIAADIGMPVAVNNRFLDHKADRATIDKRLADLERIARFTGTAIGIGYPYPVTMERISVWARSLNRKGLVLAPISAVVNRQEIQ